MRRIFRNDALNRKLEAEGFVVVSLLRESEVQQLREYYQSIAAKHTGFTTYAVNDYNLRKAVDAEIKTQLSGSAELLFEGYELFWGNFFVKESGSPPIPLHADLQYAEEPEEISLNIWCPLQDVNEENGALGIIPYSHHALHQIRGTNITNSYRMNNNNMQTRLGKILNLKSGEAIIYDHRLLHYSSPNSSDRTRLAITSVVTRKGAVKLHYYAENENSVDFEKYILPDTDVLLKTPFGERPVGLMPVEYIRNYHFKPIDVEDILKAKPGFLRQVVTLFSAAFGNQSAENATAKS